MRLSPGWHAGFQHPKIPTPFLVVDLDAMDRNIELMGAHFRDPQADLRPHVKHHKSVRDCQAPNCGWVQWPDLLDDRRGTSVGRRHRDVLSDLRGFGCRDHNRAYRVSTWSAGQVQCTPVSVEPGVEVRYAVSLRLDR